MKIPEIPPNTLGAILMVVPMVCITTIILVWMLK